MSGPATPSIERSDPDIQSMAHAIRFLAVDAIREAGEGHQGVPLGMAEIAATLFARHLKADPQNPLWPDRDRLVLSNGHGSMLLYALLHLAGYDEISLDQIKAFRKLGSLCAGHPEIEQHAGIEITTGLLGQGIACAVGMAVAEARLAAEFGSECVDHRTWAFVGDGCLQEGMGQEAISLAGHLRLGKLAFLWDDNRITDDGDTLLAISEDIPARFRAANWQVIEVDGHDIAALDAAMDQARQDPRPSLIACRTVIAKGIARLQGQRGGHSAPLTDADVADMRRDLGWNHPAFDIPRSVYDDYDTVMTRGRTEHALWKARLASDPGRAEFDRWHSFGLPSDWSNVLADLPHHFANAPGPKGTINASGAVCDALDQVLPELLVLCADLEAPTGHKRSRAGFGVQNRAGSYVHCGVREHLMGAMACGIAAHGGLRPINVTYLAFADYERAAMRMAALMKLPALFVFSHDSIGVGSNGPTHQPVETLAAYRAMPNMRVFRPADVTETAEAWQIALEHLKGPTMLALSRQDAPPVCPARSENLSRLGGYLLREPDEQRDITLIATGTEVALALQASETLKAEGINAAVVSLPCWELFEDQSADYRNAVLGQVPRIGIEAALRFGWDRYLRPEDAFVGMPGFGASAKAEVLFDHFGITDTAICNAARDLLQKH
ncbi:transketolase [Thalassococcus lentus]|uniref:Transketolase n=1 Tax=Thalassococcus lentus TaxID=1210524 RepID=A0ABT4XW48_9RHOB|nr:transketolase [Thalassococcus lentus]MDA7426182.1 transketolase [Thalassococcus lentus]